MVGRFASPPRTRHFFLVTDLLPFPPNLGMPEAGAALIPEFARVIPQLPTDVQGQQSPLQSYRHLPVQGLQTFIIGTQGSAPWDLRDEPERPRRRERGTRRLLAAEEREDAVPCLA